MKNQNSLSEIRIYEVVGDHKRLRSTRQARLKKGQKVRYSFGIRIDLNKVWEYFCGLVDNNCTCEYIRYSIYDGISRHVCPNNLCYGKEGLSRIKDTET